MDFARERTGRRKRGREGETAKKGSFQRRERETRMEGGRGRRRLGEKKEDPIRLSQDRVATERTRRQGPPPSFSWQWSPRKASFSQHGWDLSLSLSSKPTGGGTQFVVSPLLLPHFHLDVGLHDSQRAATSSSSPLSSFLPSPVPSSPPPLSPLCPPPSSAMTRAHEKGFKGNETRESERERESVESREMPPHSLLFLSSSSSSLVSFSWLNLTRP